MLSLAFGGADVEGIEKKIAAAENKVAAAENKVAAAENKVAAAKAEVAAAKAEVAAAETDQQKTIAERLLVIAVSALETSEEERKSQVSVLLGLNDVLTNLRHHEQELQTHQAAGATTTGNHEVLQKLEGLQEGLQHLSLSVQASRPAQIFESITPSGATGEHRQDFFKLLSKMGLNKEPDSPATTLQQVKSSHKDFKFDWKASASLESVDEAGSTMDDELLKLPQEAAHFPKAQQSERKSYAEVCTYLKSLGYDAVAVDSGQSLVNGDLFSEHVFSMRKQGLSVHGQAVFHITRVHGRTDIVILDNHGKAGEVTRERVKLAIEIKQPDDFKGSTTTSPPSCEAMTQLIGLNINNVYHTPPVLLTNLLGKHQVFFITKHEENPWFRISLQRCQTFLAAIQFIETLWNKDEPNYDFGRGPSPDVQE